MLLSHPLSALALAQEIRHPRLAQLQEDQREQHGVGDTDDGKQKTQSGSWYHPYSTRPATYTAISADANIKPISVYQR
jgi:hypothetical protein